MVKNAYKKNHDLSILRLRNDQEIILFSRGEGVMGLVGIVFLLISPKALTNEFWIGIFLITTGSFAAFTWVRYALCSRKRPCLEMNQEAITTSSHGSIPWSNVEKVSRISIRNRIFPIDLLVLKISNFETARLKFILPLRWLHKLNRSREVKFQLSNMSLPGDDVVQYAKSAHRLTNSSSGHSS
jgi:hypothetical protein